MEALICQSCGMPLQTETDQGTNADGSLSQEYCAYCYQEGKFANNFTMDQMIDHCVGYLEEFNKESDVKFTREQAVASMKEFFPQLKRWAKN